MRGICILVLCGAISACGSYNAVETMAVSDDAAKDMARCGGGMGIDNRVGLIVKEEAEKYGGELSASQSSEIFAKAMKEGLVSSGDGKAYDSYIQCILELDRRRGDKASLERAERLQQPALKVYLDPVEDESEKGLLRRLVVENTGEELVELQVIPAPFLQLNDLCIIRDPSDCRNKKTLQRLERAYIPVDNYYSNVSFRGSYKGELYSRREADPEAFNDMVHEFTRNIQTSRTGSMNGQVIALVRVKYKDKFQNSHDRFFDISFEQREIPPDLGRALFALRMDWLKTGKAINAAQASIPMFHSAWESMRRPKAELPKPWLQYLAWRDEV